MRSSATRHGANLRPLEKKNRKNISARRLCLLLSLLYFFSLCLRRERSIVGRITGYTVSDEHPTVLRRLCPLSTTGGHICTPIGARSSFRYARRSCVGGHVTEKRGKNVTLGRAPLDWPSPRSGTRSKYRRIEARRDSYLIVGQFFQTVDALIVTVNFIYFVRRFAIDGNTLRCNISFLQFGIISFQ